MASSIASLLTPVVLFLGQPANAPHATFERGLFCETVDLVASVVQFADRGGDPYKAVDDINRTLSRRACFYTSSVEVLMEVGRFERSIAANKTTYGIYQVYISALGHEMTEIGNLAWKFSSPVVMYTLREAPAAAHAGSNSALPSH